MIMRKKATRALSLNNSGKIANSKRSNSRLEVLINKNRYLNSKHSQFKIQQMSFMLLAVVLFFILVALFWLSIQYSGMRKQATSLEEDKSFMISQFLADSSEFNCYEENYCIDTDKIMVLMNRTVYREFWPVAYIRIRKISNESRDVYCSKLNYPDCNVFDVYKNPGIKYEGAGIGSFAALCRYDKVEGYANRICKLGKIIIGYKVK